MALELVTGYQGKDHVTAEQLADFNRGIYGDAAILPVGSEMAVDIQTANQITVKDGIGVFDGREVYIGYGETENIAIASGTQGMLRNDIVVIKYTKQEETGVESVAFEVIEGTPAASNQTDPAYSDLDIRTGVFTSQKPFCRVRINGTAIEGVDMLVDVKEIKEHAFNDLANNLTTTKPGHGLDARQGKILKDQLDAQNSALNDIALSDQIFFEKWINGSTRYEVIVNFDDVEYDQLNRIPILVGGNIGNTPFLYMYIADLPSLPQNASALTGTAIIETPLSFYVAANKDGGASRRLRIVFANQSANGAHVYIEIKARGGKVQGETASQIS